MDDVLSSDDPVCGGALTWPDSLILAVLEREHILTKAKLHDLDFQGLTSKLHVYHLRRLINLVGVMKGMHMCVGAAPFGWCFSAKTCFLMPANVAFPCSVSPCCCKMHCRAVRVCHDVCNEGRVQVGGVGVEQG